MDYNILTDNFLVKLLRDGDDRSFREIYERYWKRLYQVAHTKLKCRESAEGIIQDLFLKLWKNREAADISNLESYLYTSLKYAVINHIEKRIVHKKFVKHVQHTGVQQTISCEEQLGLRELNAVIEQSVSMMPGKTQTVFRLRKIDNYSVLEIAKYLEMSEKAVEYHITKSVKILRSHLKDYVTPLLLLLLCNVVYGQTIHKLYEGNIPNSKNVSDEEVWEANEVVDTLVRNISNPSFYVYQPPASKSNGTAVIICPGGGYHVVCINMEGKKVARAFNEAGVTAFVLKYRLPSDRTMVDKTVGPLQDVQQAIRTIRKNAAQWSIDTSKIGVMGFSAGGHLAASAGTQFNNPRIENKENINLRPDFMLLIYPVISFTDSIGHIGSRNNLLGGHASDSLVRRYSNELNVTKLTPPTFLTHSAEDSIVKVANSTRFFERLSANGVPAALHIYAKGEHGYLSETPPFSEWFSQCLYWMKEMKFVR